ncbi:MAG: LapA family protein [Nitrospirota bacterium]|nr:LapA family protein [Nitrospirota bacterium]MDH5768203.1 LapA family protein [Nitrospirota bacterium]
MQFFLFLALLIAIVLVLFAVQNSAIVSISFLTFHFEGSLAFILVVVFASGFLSGILMSIPSILRKSSALREQKRMVRQLEESMIKNAASHDPGQEKAETN